jgi:hypothetical protein
MGTITPRSCHSRAQVVLRGSSTPDPVIAEHTAGLPAEFDWHSLRHTWASWHVQNGTPLAVLMQLGGWASYAMVLRYAHLAPSHLAAYAENARVTSHKTGHTRQKLRRPKPAVRQSGGPYRDRTYEQRIKSSSLLMFS